MKTKLCLLALAGWLNSYPGTALAATAQTNTASSCSIDARMLRYPDVSATQIAFVYAGDIWVAPKSGGEALRLSSPRGEETPAQAGAEQRAELGNHVRPA